MSESDVRVRGGCCAASIACIVIAVVSILTFPTARHTEWPGDPFDVSLRDTGVSTPGGRARVAEVTAILELEGVDEPVALEVIEKTDDDFEDLRGRAKLPRNLEAAVMIQLRTPEDPNLNGYAGTLKLTVTLEHPGGGDWDAPPVEGAEAGGDPRADDPAEDVEVTTDGVLAILKEGGITVDTDDDACLRCGKPGHLRGGTYGTCMDCEDELAYFGTVAETPRQLRAKIRHELVHGKTPGGLTGTGPWYAQSGENAWRDSLVDEVRGVLGDRAGAVPTGRTVVEEERSFRFHGPRSVLASCGCFLFGILALGLGFGAFAPRDDGGGGDSLADRFDLDDEDERRLAFHDND